MSDPSEAPESPAAAVMADVFDRLGGAEGLYEWAAQSPENLKEFYRLWGKAIPQQVTGEAGGPVLIQLRQL